VTEPYLQNFSQNFRGIFRPRGARHFWPPGWGGLDFEIEVACDEDRYWDVTELVHGPTGLQTRLANARNRTRMDRTSHGSGNATGRGDGDRRCERAYLFGAYARLVHPH